MIKFYQCESRPIFLVKTETSGEFVRIHRAFCSLLDLEAGMPPATSSREFVINLDANLNGGMPYTEWISYPRYNFPWTLIASWYDTECWQ